MSGEDQLSALPFALRLEHLPDHFSHQRLEAGVIVRPPVLAGVGDPVLRFRKGAVGALEGDDELHRPVGGGPFARKGEALNRPVLDAEASRSRGEEVLLAEEAQSRGNFICADTRPADPDPLPPGGLHTAGERAGVAVVVGEVGESGGQQGIAVGEVGIDVDVQIVIVDDGGCR